MPPNLDFQIFQIFRVFEILKPVMNMFLLVVLLSILQYIFDMHFVCSCQPGLHPNGVMYMLLPSLILTFVVNIVEPFYQMQTFSSRRFFCFNGCGSCGGRYLIKLIFRYVTLTSLWISLVLFDGDWYFCLRTNFNTNQTGIPCRINLTYEEQRIKDSYKTESLYYGLYVCLGFLFLWSIAEITKIDCTARPSSRSCPPYYSVVFENLLAEEVSSRLNEELKEIATKRAMAVCKNHIEVIDKHYNLQPENDPGKVSDVWKTISHPDFFRTNIEREETPQETP